MKCALALLSLGFGLGAPFSADDEVQVSLCVNVEEVGRFRVALDLTPNPPEQTPPTMHEALALLWAGSREDQFRIARQTEEIFERLWLDTGTRDEDLDRIVASLIALLDHADDGWLRDLLAKNLAALESERLSPYFLEALDDPSPNLRHRAAEHFANVEMPEAVPRLLERLAKEKRPWIRVDLLEALDYNEVEEQGATCLELTESDDEEMAVAAVECAWMLEPPGTGPVLLQRARQGSCAVRTAALEALGSLEHPPSEPSVLDLACEATEDADRAVQAAAVVLLGTLRHPRAWDRLIALAREPAPRSITGDLAQQSLARMAPEIAAQFDEEVDPDEFPYEIDDPEIEIELPECRRTVRLIRPAGRERVHCRLRTGAEAQSDHLELPWLLPILPVDHLEIDGQHWGAFPFATTECWVRLADD